MDVFLKKREYRVKTSVCFLTPKKHSKLKSLYFKCLDDVIAQALKSSILLKIAL